MKSHLFPILLFIIIFPSFSYAGSGNDTLLLEKELELIKQQYDFLKSQTNSVTTFALEERKAHRAFLERFYVITGGVITLAIGLFAFLGYKDLKSLKNEVNTLREDAKNHITNELEIAKNQFTTLIKDKFQSEPLYKEAEERVTTLINMVETGVDLKNGRFLFLADKAFHEQLLTNELNYFSRINAKPDLKAIEDSFNINDYDVLLYYYNPVDTEEKDKDGRPVKRDQILESIINDKLKDCTIPLLVYTKSLWITGKTKDVVAEYPLYMMANNMTTLIDNSASIYRISKVLKVNSKA